MQLRVYHFCYSLLPALKMVRKKNSDVNENKIDSVNVFIKLKPIRLKNTCSSCGAVSTRRCPNKGKGAGPCT